MTTCLFTNRPYSKLTNSLVFSHYFLKKIFSSMLLGKEFDERIEDIHFFNNYL